MILTVILLLFLLIELINKVFINRPCVRRFHEFKLNLKTFTRYKSLHLNAKYFTNICRMQAMSNC